MIFVTDSIRCSEIEWQGLNDLECLGLNMVLAPQMTLTIIVICHPPSANVSFYDKFKEMLCQCEVIVMGNFNINWDEKTSRKTLNHKWF